MKKKKLLVWVLAIAIAMTNSSIVFAAETEENSAEIQYQEAVAYGASGSDDQTETLVYGDFEYKVYNGTATIAYPDGTSEKIQNPAIITKYTGNSETVEIPGTIPKDGSSLTVVELDDELFYGNTTVKKVVIPEKVASIGQYPDDTFYDALNLEEIEVADANKIYFDVDGVLFRYAANNGLPMLLKYPEAKQDESYKIPNDTDCIYSCAFNNCSTLKKIIIPSNVDTIDLYAFINLVNKVIILQQDDPQKIDLIEGFLRLDNCKIIVQNTSMKSAVENAQAGHAPLSECTNITVVTKDDSAAAPYLTKAESLSFTDGTMEKNITLLPGENYPLNTAYRMEPTDATENVTWTNTDDSIAHLVSDGSNGGSENGTINRGCIEASGRSNYPLTTGTTTFIGTDESGHKITLHVTVDAPVEKMTFATYYDSPGDENSFRDENLQIENGKVIGSIAENGKEYYYYLIVSPGCNLSIPKNLLIASSNEEIATVSWINEDDWSNKNRFWTSPVPDEEDKEPYYARIKVASLSPGTTTITATLDDNGMIWTDSFELTVTEPEQGSNPVPNVPVQIPSVPVPTTPDTTASNIPASTNTTTANISKPAKMKAPVVKAGKKKLTVSWKKDSKVDGYQIQYSTNSKFKKAKSLNCSKKTTKNTIKKLKSGKKYYIRIRAYKKISGKKYYGNWSKAKTVKVK